MVVSWRPRWEVPGAGQRTVARLAQRHSSACTMETRQRAPLRCVAGTCRGAAAWHDDTRASGQSLSLSLLLLSSSSSSWLNQAQRVRNCGCETLLHMAPSTPLLGPQLLHHGVSARQRKSCGLQGCRHPSEHTPARRQHSAAACWLRRISDSHCPPKIPRMCDALLEVMTPMPAGEAMNEGHPASLTLQTAALSVFSFNRAYIAHHTQRGARSKRSHITPRPPHTTKPLSSSNTTPLPARVVVYYNSST